MWHFWVFLVLLIGGVAMEGIIRILVLVLVVALVLTRVRVSRTNSVMVVVMVSRVGDLLLRGVDLLLSWKRAIT